MKLCVRGFSMKTSPIYVAFLATSTVPFLSASLALCYYLYRNYTTTEYVKQGTKARSSEAKEAIRRLVVNHEGDICGVVVEGVSGSGKSTLAAQLSDLLGFVYGSVDQLQFVKTGGWKVNSSETKRKGWMQVIKQGEETRAGWVFDGANKSVHDLYTDKITVAIHLDFPYSVVLPRLLRRSLLRVIKREKLWGTENVETWDKVLKLWDKRESILSWQAEEFLNYRNKKPDLLKSFNPKILLTFRSPDDLQMWLDDLKREKARRLSLPAVSIPAMSK
eukprot:m.41594 g.41594  ORF g.41594 m.41594 type:complete len:276 (+) comp9785_c0_seq2:142-969(+)